MEDKKEEKAPVTTLAENKKEEKEVEPPKYTPDEEIYIRKLQTKLQAAKLLKEKVMEEFDNTSLVTYVNQNERYANTIIQNKQNKGETVFQSGTLRTKMMSFLNSFIASNFKPEITPFGKNNMPLHQIGNSFEDIIEKTEEKDMDEEKKMLRQYEMLKQGSVFVEDVYEDTTEISKTVSSGVLGQIKGVQIKTARKPGCGRFTRRIISPLGIYLGSWRHYFVEEQPYLFTAEVWDRSEAEKVYGTWERWGNVPKKKKQFSGTVGSESMLDNSWRLTSEIGENEVERIVYQDKPNNEIQIVLNGVPMLPMGYPLTEISPDGEYTIIQQNLEPIRHDFAMGKSFIFKNKNISAILDEMMKLAVLKTQKSFLPPYLNLSGRVVNSRIFMPAEITRGIQPNELVPVSDKESQGVTNAEFNMIQEVIRFNDANTASQTFTGAKEGGANVTATQIAALQKQAKLMMGVVELAATLLEEKLASRRMVLILRHWFDPIDQEMDAARNMLKDKYRPPIVKMGYIKGRGQGARMTLMAEDMPSEDQIKYEEERMQKAYGYPVKITVLNPKAIKEARITWQINVVSKPKKTSELERIMFSEEIASAQTAGIMPNPAWLEEKFAQVWNEDPNKMFSKEGMMPQLPKGMMPEMSPDAAMGAPMGAPAKSNIKPQITLKPQ